MPIVHTARVAVTGGRNGRARAVDGHLDLALALPASLGGTGAGTTSEDLLGAAYAACFTSTLQHLAPAHGIDAARITGSHADVALSLGDDGLFALSLALRVDAGGLDEAALRPLIDAALRTCPFARALHGNVDVRVSVA